MTLTPELIILGKYLVGEFDNQKQALNEPAWYVHLRLWLRPVPLFTQDSITLFAEQANIVNLDRPYRQRILRIRQTHINPTQIEVEHYMFVDNTSFLGAGFHPDLLQTLSINEIKFLPNCNLSVQIDRSHNNNYNFKATPIAAKPCSFTYQNNTYQVALGFEVDSDELKTYDRGIDPKTGKAIWGALLGPYCFTKRESFSSELFV